MGLRRLITSAVVVAMAGVFTAPASAYPGDWVINGQFERTTAPSFRPGFNPNDVDTLLVQFDNRRKTLSVRLDFFETPDRGPRGFSVGLGQTNGSTCGTSMGVGIDYRDAYITVERPATQRVYVPESIELIHTAIGSTPVGIGWRFDGIDANGYRWLRTIPAYNIDVPTTTTETTIDPSNHIRIGTLSIGGVGGSLAHNITVANNSRTWTFEFAHVLLNNLSANCAIINVPDRATPFVVSGPVVPAPVASTTTVAPTSSDSVRSVSAKTDKKVKVKKKVKRKQRKT